MKPCWNQERLDDLLDRVARLRQRCRNRLDADRAAAIVYGNRREIAPIHGVELGLIDLERSKRAIGDSAVNRSRLADEGEIAAPAQQPAGNARRAAGAPRDLVCAVGSDRDAEHARAAVDDQFKLRRAVEIEPDRDSETVAQRICQQARPGGGTDQSEWCKINLDRARGGT
jgi:hypothetical protein